MPKLTLELPVEIDFTYHKAERESGDCPGYSEDITFIALQIHHAIGYSVNDIDNDTIEKLIWENREDWKED